ncbi:heterogeneous nuclear ribonucleoprotein U [Trichuris trichiura]|uniref:Heterogeneous nuclear ribonucleoprotein U n=1 Tax=Trichuris trichiura TaxID=36087 RepID=A0A077ZE40_TRITR|nr:heterogeneous nuclear ribonucleoprotein U [Trichuris trichiura]
MLFDDEDDELEELEDEFDIENIDSCQVYVDPYNSDLNLFVSAAEPFVLQPYSVSGFAHLLAGGKASYGVAKGRVGFEVKLLEEIKTQDVDFKEEVCWHELRIGWSTEDSAHNRLGELECSYAYCNNGKKATGNVFTPWGENFWPMDVITCLVDFGSGSIAFCKNGQSLGTAFNLKNDCFSTKLLFPSFTARNVKFEVNFGHLEKPWFPLPEGFSFINDVHVTDRCRGPLPAASKEDCIVIMMIGLPGCGKSTWVKSFILKSPEYRWLVLSPSVVLDQMSIQGIPRKKVHQGRWDIVMGTAAKCFLKLLQLACRRKRNYIIDGLITTVYLQTNVCPWARKRKLSAFRDFHRRAVIIVPPEEEYAYRYLMESTNKGKRIPSEVLMEMKGSNFTLPKLEEGHFNEITYIELQEEDAGYVVERYNEEGKNSRPQDKRRRNEHRDDGAAILNAVVHVPKKKIVPPVKGDPCSELDETLTSTSSLDGESNLVSARN